MRRLNIVKDKKIETKSFLNIDDLAEYLDKLNPPATNFILNYNFGIAEKIFDLNVGKSLYFFDWKISVNSKRRVGNQLTDGTIIGAEQ